MKSALLLGWLSLLTFFLISISLSRTDGAVLDEFNHIGAGYAYIFEGYFNLNLLHPPLIKFLSGLGLKALSLPALAIDPARSANNYGHAIFYTSGIAPAVILFAARLPVLLLNYILLLYLFIQLRKFLGDHWGSITTTMFAASPLFLGHAHLVTMDVGIALTMSIALVQYLLESRSNTSSPYWRTILWANLGLWIKYNSLLIFGFLGATSLFLSLVSPSNRRRHLLFFLLLSLSLITTITSIGKITVNTEQIKNSKIAFEPSSAVPVVSNSWLTPPAQFFEANSPAAIVVRRVRALAVHIFQAPTSAAFLFGNVYKNGDWRFFPTLFFCKEMVEFLCFIFLGIVFFFIYAHKVEFEPLVLALYALTFLVFTFLASIQTGIRYLLPLYPVLLLIASLGFKHSSIPKPILQNVSIIFAFFTTIHTLLVYPGYISNFNVLSRFVGEPYYIGGDTNLDWGQDVPRLASLISKAQGPIYTDVNSYVEPALLFGSKVQAWDILKGPPPKGSIIAISSYIYGWKLFHSKKDPEMTAKLNWIEAAQRLPNVGGSILVFEIK